MKVSPQSFPVLYRLRAQRDFVRLAQSGQVFATHDVVIRWGTSNVSHVRFGVTIARRFGSAVKRNTFRRRAKEAFRRSKLRDLCGIDINLKPKHTLSVSYSDFCQLFESFHIIVSRFISSK